MDALTAWAIAHQGILTLVLLAWPALTFIVNLCFKPRSPEEYAALPPRIAGFLKFVASSGLDPVGAVQGLGKLLVGMKLPPGAGVFLIGVVGFSTAIGCAFLQSPAGREVTKDAVDAVCILANAELPMPAILDACHFAEEMTAEQRAARVVAILAAHKAAMAREHKAGCPHPVDGCDPWSSPDAGKDAGGDSATDAGKDAK